MGSLKVVYPIYFERSISRKQGRRVTKDRSFDNVKLEDLIHATKKLGLKYTEEKKRHHPARWWLEEGRILVNTELSKERLLRKIGDAMKDEFSKRPAETKDH